MSIPTAAELTLLRTRPHATKLWLSVYKPPTVLACQVATSHGKEARVIDYNNITSGSYTAIESGMTMLVGSVAGKGDIGKIRVRSATSTTITVAGNADIQWTAGQYLTVLRFWEIQSIFPRIIQDPANEMNTLWYKDYDIAYTNQNDVLGSFICMGSHFAGFLEGGSCNVFYSASGTHNVAGDAVTYNWWFQGGTVTGSSVHTPGNITYNAPGQYTTRLRVTTPTGSYDTSYRHISIYDRPENGTNIPILNWNLEMLSGNRDQGGYTGRIWVREAIDSIVDGALVVIFADDYYGSTKQSIGGNALGRQNVVFMGYILEGSIEYSYKDSSCSFEIVSPSEIMKTTEVFAVGLNDSASPALEPGINKDIPSGWACIKDMTVKKSIYHFLTWHSTALMCNDFEFVGTDQRIQYFDANRESLYSAIQSIMAGALIGEITCDRQGKIWAEIGASITNNASTAFPSNIIVDKQDWIDGVMIEERPNKSVSFLEMGGIAYPGPGYDSTAYMASAPGSGDFPSYRGDMEQIQGLALSNQDHLNAIAGNLFAWRNARFPVVQFRLAGNYRNFDIAPQEVVKMVINPVDNSRRVEWNGKAFFIRSLEYEYDAQKEIFFPQISLHEATTGLTGTSISIPVVPPTQGYNQPPISIPAIPSFPILIYFSGTAGGGGGNFPEFKEVEIGYDNGTTTVLHPLYYANPLAIYLSKTATAYGRAIFKVPKSFTGNLTVYSIIGQGYGAFADGNVVIDAEVTKYSVVGTNQWDNGLNTYTNGPTIYYFVRDYIYAVLPITFSVGEADIIQMLFRRYGADASDDFSGTLSILGFAIVYS